MQATHPIVQTGPESSKTRHVCVRVRDSRCVYYTLRGVGYNTHMYNATTKPPSPARHSGKPKPGGFHRTDEHRRGGHTTEALFPRVTTTKNSFTGRNKGGKSSKGGCLQHPPKNPARKRLGKHDRAKYKGKKPPRGLQHTPGNPARKRPGEHDRARRKGETGTWAYSANTITPPSTHPPTTPGPAVPSLQTPPSSPGRLRQSQWCRSPRPRRTPSFSNTQTGT